MAGERRIARRDVRFALVFAAFQLIAYLPVALLIYGLMAMWSREGQAGELHVGSLVTAVGGLGAAAVVAFVCAMTLCAATGVLGWVMGPEPSARREPSAGG